MLRSINLKHKIYDELLGTLLAYKNFYNTVKDSVVSKFGYND